MDEHDRQRSDSWRDAQTTSRTLRVRKTTAKTLTTDSSRTGIINTVRANNRFRVKLDTIVIRCQASMLPSGGAQDLRRSALHLP